MNRNLSFCLDMLTSALPALLIPVALSALFALVANIGGCALRGKEPDNLSSASHDVLIHGSVFYREKMALPRHAELTIVLYERTPQIGRELLSEIRTPTEGQSVPLPFAISRPENPPPDVEYEVEAHISADGMPLFATPSAVMIPRNPDKPLAILVQRIMSEETALDSPVSLLTHNRWILRNLNDQPVTVYKDQPEPHLLFAPTARGQHPEEMTEGRIAGSDGCNSIFGGYQIKNSAIQFLDMGSTMMACVQGEEQAQNFNRSLQETSEWRIVGNNLILLRKGQALAIFEAVAR